MVATTITAVVRTAAKGAAAESFEALISDREQILLPAAVAAADTPVSAATC